MARPQRNNVDYFPIWKPSNKVKFAIDDMIDRRHAFKLFRSSSSAFIKNKHVRYNILIKCNHKCVICFSDNLLEVDHIISVYKCFHDSNYYKCNIRNNLQILCKKCNTAKLP